MSKILSIEEMLAASDVQYVEIDAWGGKVRLGSLTAGDMIDFVEANDGPAKKTAGLRLIIRSLVDKDGTRIGKPEQLEGFKKKDARITNRLVDVILKLNGLSQKDAADAKNDSGEAVTGASPMPSPSN